MDFTAGSSTTPTAAAAAQRNPESNNNFNNSNNSNINNNNSNNEDQAVSAESSKLHKLVTSILAKYTSTLGSGLSLDNTAILSTQLFYNRTQLIYTSETSQGSSHQQPSHAAKLTNDLLQSASSLIDYHLNMVSSTASDPSNSTHDSVNPSLLRLRFGQYELFIIPDMPYTLVALIDKSRLNPSS